MRAQDDPSHYPLFFYLASAFLHSIMVGEMGFVWQKPNSVSWTPKTPITSILLSTRICRSRRKEVL